MVAGGGHVWLLGCVCVVARGHVWLLGGHVWLLGGHAWLVGGMHGFPGACMVSGGHAWFDCVFYPYFQGFMEGRSLLVVYVFTSPDSPRGPPWNEGHRPKVRHETSVLEVPASGTTRNTVSVLVLLMHLFHTLYTQYAGTAHHRVLQTSGRGWADSKAVHGTECSGGAHALLEVSLSVGAAA